VYVAFESHAVVVVSALEVCFGAQNILPQTTSRVHSTHGGPDAQECESGRPLEDTILERRRV
jgi:hypothetical protein